MKKKFFVFLLAATGVVLISATSLSNFSVFNRSSNTTLPTSPTQINANYQAKVVISAPDENVFVEYESQDNKTYQPFSLLEEASEKNNIPLEFETYDFGVYVKSIENLESTNEKAWIYFVNGESGQVAADKMDLKKGDLVEWKYIAPSM